MILKSANVSVGYISLDEFMSASIQDKIHKTLVVFAPVTYEEILKVLSIAAALRTTTVTSVLLLDGGMGERVPVSELRPFNGNIFCQLGTNQHTRDHFCRFLGECLYL